MEDHNSVTHSVQVGSSASLGNSSTDEKLLDIRNAPPKAAFFVIASAHAMLHEYLRQELEKKGAEGLVASHGNILGCLYSKGPMPMSQIAQSIDRRKSTLTVLANKLEQLGYIERIPSREDSRSKELSLTEKGTAFYQSFQEISDNLQDMLWQGIAVSEQEQFMRILGKMTSNLRSATNTSGTSGTSNTSGTSGTSSTSGISGISGTGTSL